MKLYLDMCCLKRPFDDQTDARVQMETLAVEAILQMCRQGDHQLISSDALRFENTRNPNQERKEFAQKLLASAVLDLPHSAQVEKMADKWQNVGVALLDSLHLASAEQAGADAFASTDDALLRRAAKATSNLRVLALVDLFKELVP